jgi:hypothetical protein
MKAIYYPFRLDKEIPPGLPRTRGSPFEKPQTKVLAPQIQRAIDELAFRAAASEADAAEWLYELAATATNHLVNLAKRTPEVLRPIARSWPVFPVLSSPKEERTERTKRLLASLGVAASLGQRFSPKSRWSGENLATQYAEALEYTLHFNIGLVTLQRAQSPPAKRLRLEQEVTRFPALYRQAGAFPEWVKRAAELPEFSQASAAEWFSVAWGALMEATNRQPENVKELRALGKYREKHRCTAKPGSRTRESDIRDGIKTSLKRAMLSIAPELPAPSAGQIESSPASNFAGNEKWNTKRQ